MESITGGNTSKYQELTEQLRLQIVSGEIAPGQKLPSENTLSAQYQVSRQTHWRFCRMRDTFMPSMGEVLSAPI